MTVLSILRGLCWYACLVHIKGLVLQLEAPGEPLVPGEPLACHALQEAGDWLELGLLQSFVIHLIINSSQLLQWQDEIAALSAPSWVQR